MPGAPGLDSETWELPSARLSSFYHYDAAGNVIYDGSNHYGQTATYVYNALNQRVRTVAGGATTGFIFNGGGQRVSEWS